MNIVCKICSTPFQAPPSRVKTYNVQYCSKKCHDRSQENKVTKKCKFCKNILSVRPSEVPKFSTCTSKICRSKNKHGKNNPNFRHGKTKQRKLAMATTKYKHWRTQILKRDKYTCLFCGIKAKKGLHVDHIKP